MDKVYVDKKHCCGCTACYSICPCKAINMEADKEGFLYPHINQDKCIDCKACVNVCMYNCKVDYKNKGNSLFYVAKHKSHEVLMNSTSGGAFTAISDAILAMNGVIYGVGFDGNYKTLHKRAKNAIERDEFRISKYSQSDMNTIYEQVKSDLQNNIPVLFTGTPCQNAGLKAFIKNNKLRQNLYLCDVICHSIPSPLIWSEYIKLLEKEHGDKISAVQFRSKIVKWSRENSNKSFIYFLKNKRETYYTDERFYKLFFDKQSIMRPSCENCLFTDVKRVSDITIADYWGIEKYSPEWMDSKGVSLIMLNSVKGNELLDKASKDIDFEERESKEAITEQKRLSEPIKFPKDRDEFWNDYNQFGFEYIIKGLNKE